MQQTVKANKTMLVDGPASARLVSGKAEVYGYPLKESQRIVVRAGKRLPFYAIEETVLEVSLGPNATLAEMTGGTIPKSWNIPIEAVLGLQKRPVVIMILGAADCGKSSLCTYLFNKLVYGRRRVAVLDGDVGQSDIGPSATVGYGIATRPVPQLHNLKLKNAVFVGVTSPLIEMIKVIEGLAAMKAEILQQQVDFVLINTDGWVSGDIAFRYKTALIEALKPDIVVGLQVQDELVPLVANLQIPAVMVEPSPALNVRTPEKRKILREMTYSRYLKNAKLQCYPRSQMTVEPRSAIPKNQEPEKGILVGIYGRANKFLGIGVLRLINPVRKVLKVQTAVSAKPFKLVIGKVVVNEKLQEVI